MTVEGFDHASLQELADYWMTIDGKSWTVLGDSAGADRLRAYDEIRLTVPAARHALHAALGGVSSPGRAHARALQSGARTHTAEVRRSLTSSWPSGSPMQRYRDAWETVVGLDATVLTGLDPSDATVGSVLTKLERHLTSLTWAVMPWRPRALARLLTPQKWRRS